MKAESAQQPGIQDIEARLSAALAVARLGTFEWNVRTDTVKLDQRSCEIFGFALDEVSTAQEVFNRIHPEDSAQVRAQIQSCLKTLSRLDIEYRIITAAGLVRTIVCISDVRPGTDGQAERTVGVFRDVTERKQAAGVLSEREARQKYQLMLADSIRTIRDPEVIKATACRVLGEELRTNRAFYAEVEGDDWIVQARYERGVAPMQPGRYSAATYGHRIMDTYRAGKRLVFRDARIDPDFAPEERKAHVTINILSAIGIPLVKEGTLVAILAVHSSEPRDWAEHEIALVEETAERTWSAVERARAEAAERTSEGKYRMLFNSIDEGFCIIEILLDDERRPVDYRFLETNPTFEQHTGLHNAVGRTAREMVPDLEQFWFELYGQVALTGNPNRFINTSETMGRTFDVYAFRAGEPEELKVALLFRDITKQERTNTALQDSEARFRAIVSQATAGIAQVDLTGRFLIVNDRYCTIVGRTREELMSLRMQDITHPDYLPHNLGLLKRALETGEPFVVEKPYVLPDGQSVWVSNSVSVVRDVSGRPQSILAITIDISERVKAEEELRKANRELEEFAYVASHDLQEPLRMVNVYTQLLTRRHLGDAPEAKDYAEIIHRGVGRMEALIHDLLAFSRTIHPQEEIQVSTADLSAALTEATSVLKDRIEATGALIDHPLLPTVRGDTTQIAQVFQNLLSNAIKYQDNGTRPQVNITATCDGDCWTIAVKDNGIGFDSKYSDRIFGLFKRLHKDEYPGTGLGLAICRRIIERHGGRIWAKSSPGEGSTFYFSLPRSEGA